MTITEISVLPFSSCSYTLSIKSFNFFLSSSDISKLSQLRTHRLNGLVPMPCPFVPTKATRDLNPSGVNHWNKVFVQIKISSNTHVVFIPYSFILRHFPIMQHPTIRFHIWWPQLIPWFSNGRLIHLVISVWRIICSLGFHMRQVWVQETTEFVKPIPPP